MSRFPLHERQRLKLLPLAGMVLAAYALFVFLPLSKRARSLDAPLEANWRKLSAALHQTNAASLDLAGIVERLRQTRQSMSSLMSVQKQAALRVDLGEDIATRMREQFQLVDYQNERQRIISELAGLSQQGQTALEPPVLGGLPEYTAEVQQPSLLWAQLSFINHLLTTAVHCKISVVHALSVPATLAESYPTNRPPVLSEIPMQMELTGAAAHVMQFLESLPLRAEEIKAAGLPEAPTNKPALFIDKLMLRRQSPDKPDEVRLSLRVFGFVFPE